jgi:hypothetical protein
LRWELKLGGGMAAACGCGLKLPKVLWMNVASQLKSNLCSNVGYQKLNIGYEKTFAVNFSLVD